MANNPRLKNRTVISTAIDNELFKRFKEYSEETSVPMSKLLDKAVAMFLASVEHDKNR